MIEHEKRITNNKTMLYIAADHAGFKRKEWLKKYLIKLDYSFEDLGADQLKPDDDYPDYAYLLAKKVASNPGSQGILLCGSGQGVCIVANKVPGIRAVLGYNTFAAESSRLDDDTNILCLPARDLRRSQVKKIVQTWLQTGFSGADRHKRRLQKINDIEARILAE